MKVNFFSDAEQEVQHQVVYYGPQDKKFLFNNKQDALDFFNESCKWLIKEEFDKILCFLEVIKHSDKKECHVEEYYEYSMEAQETSYLKGLRKRSLDSLDVLPA